MTDLDPKTQAYMDTRMNSCRAEVESHIKLVSQDMHQLRTEFHALRADVHSVTRTVEDIATSLKTIAHSVNKLSDLPDTWEKVKGFWSVVSWLRSNFFPAATLIVLLIYLGSASDAVNIIKGLFQ